MKTRLPVSDDQNRSCFRARIYTPYGGKETIVGFVYSSGSVTTLDDYWPAVGADGTTGFINVESDIKILLRVGLLVASTDLRRGMMFALIDPSDHLVNPTTLRDLNLPKPTIAMKPFELSGCQIEQVRLNAGMVPVYVGKVYRRDFSPLTRE